MFSTVLSSYDGDVKVGDLVELHSGMMLVEPNGPVLILSEVGNNVDAWDAMYLSNNYHTTIDRLDIKSVISS